MSRHERYTTFCCSVVGARRGRGEREVERVDRGGGGVVSMFVKEVFEKSTLPDVFSLLCSW